MEEESTEESTEEDMDGVSVADEVYMMEDGRDESVRSQIEDMVIDLASAPDTENEQEEFHVTRYGRKTRAVSTEVSMSVEMDDEDMEWEEEDETTSTPTTEDSDSLEYEVIPIPSFPLPAAVASATSPTPSTASPTPSTAASPTPSAAASPTPSTASPTPSTASPTASPTSPTASPTPSTAASPTTSPTTSPTPIANPVTPTPSPVNANYPNAEIRVYNYNQASEKRLRERLKQAAKMQGVQLTAICITKMHKLGRNSSWRVRHHGLLCQKIAPALKAILAQEHARVALLKYHPKHKAPPIRTSVHCDWCWSIGTLNVATTTDKEYDIQDLCELLHLDVLAL